MSKELEEKHSADDLVEVVARAIQLCPVCEGEGHVADGLDEAACSTPCPPCFGTGYDAQAVLHALSPHLSEREKIAAWLRPTSGYDANYDLKNRLADAISRGDHIGGEGR